MWFCVGRWLFIDVYLSGMPSSFRICRGFSCFLVIMITAVFSFNIGADWGSMLAITYKYNKTEMTVFLLACKALNGWWIKWQHLFWNQAFFFRIFLNKNIIYSTFLTKEMRDHGVHISHSTRPVSPYQHALMCQFQSVSNLSCYIESSKM